MRLLTLRPCTRSAYHTGTWYWEVVELMRKLALTSILSLIAPGSAGQGALDAPNCMRVV